MCWLGKNRGPLELIYFVWRAPTKKTDPFNNETEEDVGRLGWDYQKEILKSYYGPNQNKKCFYG